ncbi:hypothetical protein GCM10007933_24060 [Zoogloea oryzae]|uniref:Peptidase M48 domain-containing protein n=2 Tax=Zoogloea oryzae TaxID=310767 RepID=A0ABQ6FBG3_9RHOO|nr:hypothetical protein GCM10007933_24060 [Zoogloea oryzae]
MNSALEDWVAMYSSVKASQSYDDAISFVVAHEIAHRALQHYDRLQSGAALQDLETEADRLAALLVVLARNTKVYPDDDYILFGPPPGRITITRKDFFGDPESICLLDLNYKPSGHISFFRYGYSFSGFDSLGKGNAMIVPSAVRLAIASSVSDAAVWAIREAQWDTGTCHNSNKELQAVAQDPEGQISRLLGEARTEGDKHSDKTAEPDSDIQYEFRRSTIAANEPQVVKTIYLEYFEQLRR